MYADDTMAALTFRARRFAERTAVVCGSRRLSYAELDDRVGRLAQLLANAGLKAGDIASIYGAVGWEWVVAYHAVLRAGATVNPINALLTASEVGFILANCNSQFLLADLSRMEILNSAKVVDGINVIAFEDLDDLTGQGPALPVPEDLSAEAISTVCYTSGTTGRPKGAMLSHRSVMMNAALTALMHGRGPRDITVSALPLAHVYGTVIMNSTLLCGGQLVLLPSFDPGATIEAIAEHKATRFEGVPTMYYRLLAELAQIEAVPQSLTMCTVGGQTMPVDKMRLVEEAFGCPLLELWGMSEIGGLGTTFPWTGPRTLGSIGIPLPFVQTRVIDTATGSLAGDGEVGELHVRGPLVMSGYLGNSDATAEVLSEDGWLATGDVVRIDAHGRIYVIDRAKDLILTSGNNVYPAEIERVISEIPGVVLVGVGRDPHPDKGEVPHAYLVLAAGAQVTQDEVIAHCRVHLAPYKIPRSVSIVEDIPKTSSGKIMRRALVGGAE